MSRFFNLKFQATVVNLVAFSTVFLLTSCHYYKTPEENADLLERDPIDREGNITRREFREIIRPQKTLSKLDAESGVVAGDANYDEDGGTVPPILDTMLAVDAPDIDSAKRVSLTVDETIELRDVLLELARLAELELALDPSITGGVILTVKNRPVGEVMEMIAELANLQYTVNDGLMKVSRDAPYLENYHVDYLNMTRNSTGNMDVSTSSGSGGGGGSSSSGGGDSGGGDFSSASSFTAGSATSISTESSGDLWGAVETNINSILSAQLSRTQGSSSDSSSDTSDGSSVTLNRQAGVISVFATQKKHKAIKKYLDMVLNNTSAQVLIEAKILEVELNDSYATGIDWSLARGAFSVTNTQGLALDSLSNTFLTNTVFSGLVSLPTASKQFTNAKTVLTFLEGFGTTRALSNPRITIQNNQQAVLSFARNEAFFTIEVTPASTTTTGTTTSSSSETAISSSLNTVPIGVILALQPSINMDTQEVTMHIRPTLTSKVGDIQDPAVRINAILLAAGDPLIAAEVSNLNSPIPIIQVRELDTVLKAKSGEVMIIGGLLQHSDRNADIGLPFLSEIPLIGNLTKKVEKTSKVVETIILMTAKIIPPRGNYHEHDKQMFRELTQDPRPFNF